MPKPHTFPTLYDDLKTVSISFLAKHGYLKPNQLKSGSIHWGRNGKKWVVFKYVYAPIQRCNFLNWITSATEHP